MARVPADAARTLDQALALWRGPPLADFRYEPFAQTEIARLEELRLTCLEERIEARLAMGSAGELIAELRQLVREHPFARVFMVSSCWPSTAAAGRPKRSRSTATSGVPCAKNSVGTPAGSVTRSRNPAP